MKLKAKMVGVAVILSVLGIMHSSVYAQPTDTSFTDNFRHRGTAKPDRMSRELLHGPFAPKTLSQGSSFGVVEAWVRHYGSGKVPSDDIVTDIVVDSDGNVYVTGYTTTLPFGYDYHTIKYDAVGNEVWAKRYDGPAHGDDFAIAIGLDSAGAIYVTGRSIASIGADYATIKYSSTGDEIWVSRYEGTESPWSGPAAMHVDDLGNVYITGRIHTLESGADYLTIKYDSNGEEVWSKRYDGPAHEWDRAYALAVAASGNVYVTGYSEHIDTGWDFLTIKYDDMGAEQWLRRYTGPGNHRDNAIAVAIAPQGDVVVTGVVKSDTTTAFVSIRYDSAGAELWVARRDFVGGRGPTGLAIDEQGNIYVAGQKSEKATGGDIVVIKYQPDGTEEWLAVYDGGGTNWRSDRARNISLDSTGNAYVTGYTDGFDRNFDYITIKYDQHGVEQWLVRYGTQFPNWGYAKNFVDTDGNIYIAASPGESFHPFTPIFSMDYGTVKYNSDGEELWRAEYNGEGTSFDEVIGVFLEDSGNIKVVGKTGRQSAGYGMVTYSSDGTALSSADFRGPAHHVDNWVNPTAIDADGNIYFGGQLYDTNRVISVISKYDTFGNEIWVQNFSGFPRHIVVDENGYVYVAGTVTVKYDENGTELWTRLYNDELRENFRGRALTVDTNGNVYVVGSSNNSSDFNSDVSVNFTILKYNGNGDQQWVKSYAGPENSYDTASFVIVDGSGNIYVAGWSRKTNDDYDYALIKYDETGTELWVARFDGSAWDRPQDFAVDDSHNVYVTGSWTVKYDSSGTPQWASEQGGEFMALDDDGNVYLTGAASHDWQLTEIVTARLDQNGQTEWITNYLSLGYTYDFPMGIVVDQNRDVFVAGTSWGEKNWMVYTLIKYEQAEEAPNVPSDFNLEQNYPNPFNSGTSIEYSLPTDGFVTLKVYNLLGREVETLVHESKEAGEHGVSWQPKNLASGVYIYQLRISRGSGQIFSEARKLVLLK